MPTHTEDCNSEAELSVTDSGHIVVREQCLQPSVCLTTEMSAC